MLADKKTLTLAVAKRIAGAAEQAAIKNATQRLLIEARSAFINRDPLWSGKPNIVEDTVGSGVLVAPV